MVFTFFLKLERVLHLLMVSGRLFHRVAAAFHTHLLPYVTPCIFGTIISDSDSDLRDLVGNGCLALSAAWGCFRGYLTDREKKESAVHSSYYPRRLHTLFSNSAKTL